MKLDLQEIYENDENLNEHVQALCGFSDILRYPYIDAEEKKVKIFEYLVAFLKRNHKYIEKIMENINEDAQEDSSES